MEKLFKDLVNVLLKQFVVLLLIIVFVVIGYHYRKDIQIAYHKWGQESALKSMRKYGSPSSEDDFIRYEKYSQKLQSHQNALIEIGYLAKRTFNTKYLEAYSAEMQKATNEFVKIHPNSSLSFSGIVKGELKINITCRTDFMPAMEELIEKYDVPPVEPNDY